MGPLSAQYCPCDDARTDWGWVGQPDRNPPKPVQIYSAECKAEEGGADGPSQGAGGEVAVDLANRGGRGGPGEDGAADGAVRTGRPQPKAVRRHPAR
jgi:hypothetical protein